MVFISIYLSSYSFFYLLSSYNMKQWPPSTTILTANIVQKSMSGPNQSMQYPVITAIVPSPNDAAIMKLELSDGLRLIPYSLGVDSRSGNTIDMNMPNPKELYMIQKFPYCGYIWRKTRELIATKTHPRYIHEDFLEGVPGSSRKMNLKAVMTIQNSDPQNVASSLFWIPLITAQEDTHPPNALSSPISSMNMKHNTMLIRKEIVLGGRLSFCSQSLLSVAASQVSGEGRILQAGMAIANAIAINAKLHSLAPQTIKGPISPPIPKAPWLICSHLSRLSFFLAQMMHMLTKMSRVAFMMDAMSRIRALAQIPGAHENANKLKHITMEPTQQIWWKEQQRSHTLQRIEPKPQPVALQKKRKAQSVDNRPSLSAKKGMSGPRPVITAPQPTNVTQQKMKA